MKQKIIEFILENLILEEGRTAEEWAEEIWAEEVLTPGPTTVSFMPALTKNGKKCVLYLDGKVEAFRVREGWPYGLVARRFEPDSIPEGYYLTKEEAKAVYEEKQIVVANSRKLVQPKADETFRKVKKDYEQLLQALKHKYNAELHPDASASDDTGLETYMTTFFTIKGEDGISHGFSYQLKV